MSVTTTTRIATSDTSALYCKGCGEFFTIEQGERIVGGIHTGCDTCGAVAHSAEVAGAAVRAQDADLAIEPRTALERSWFHVTARKDWSTDILEPVVYQKSRWVNGTGTLMVHLGTIEAARDRLKMLVDDDPHAEGFYLYEVRLSADAEVNSTVLSDAGGTWPEATAEVGTHRGNRYDYRGYSTGVNLYVNSYEAPGSISLLVGAQDVQVISSMQIDPATFMPI